MMNGSTGSESMSVADKKFFVFNAVVSALALSLLAWLLLIRRGAEGGQDLSFMPGVNAGFNALAATLLLSGLVCIKRRRVDLHKRFMVSAFAASSLFLVGYVVYHYVHGDTKFTGTGTIRNVYFSILISHVLLSIGVVPLALTAFYFAWRKRFATHAKVARILFPIWLYVSVTGVVIYFMLRP
jgi:putative membrane protein